MKLHYNPASPFVRLVLATAIAGGLRDKIELVEAIPTPTATLDGLNADNPLGKIPALTTDDGLTLYDSRVICEYLNQHAGGGLMPSNDAARYRALTRLALAVGAMDAAILIRYETWLRPEEYRWDDWTEGQWGKLNRALDQLEADADDLAGDVRLDRLAAGCLLGYIDLRFADAGWRDTRPKLSAWYDNTAAKQPALLETAPPQ